MQLAQQRAWQLLEAGEQGEEDVARRLGVLECAVSGPHGDVEEVGDRGQVEVVGARQQDRGDLGAIELDAGSLDASRGGVVLGRQDGAAVGGTGVAFIQPRRILELDLGQADGEFLRL